MLYQILPIPTHELKTLSGLISYPFCAIQTNRWWTAMKWAVRVPASAMEFDEFGILKFQHPALGLNRLNGFIKILWFWTF